LRCFAIICFFHSSGFDNLDAAILGGFDALLVDLDRNFSGRCEVFISLSFPSSLMLMAQLPPDLQLATGSHSPSVGAPLIGQGDAAASDDRVGEGDLGDADC
jgi:hypothetical protein